MITATETGQLAGECTMWIDTLRSFRNRFNNYKLALMEISPGHTEKDVLLEIEHLDNQFHIQLVNIHDLKQSVKRHMQKIGYERTHDKGILSDDVLARHEYLYDEYQRLETTLHIISREFDRFVKHVQHVKKDKGSYQDISLDSFALNNKSLLLFLCPAESTAGTTVACFSAGFSLGFNSPAL